MIDKLSMQLTSLICTEAYSSAKDRAKIQYGLNVLLSEGFKIFSLFIFFNMIHKQNYFYFSLLILLTMRVFSGGIHVKSALNCLLLTLALFSFTSVLAPIVPKLPVQIYIMVSTISLAGVLIKAPICTVRQPFRDNRIRLLYKLTAALLVAFWTVILLSFSNTAYINCGFCTIFLQNFQLLMVLKKHK